MQKFFHKILRLVLNKQITKHKKQMAHLSAFTSGTSKTVFHGATELTLNTQTENKKSELNVKVKQIIKSSLNDPEKLFEIIQNEGTDVFRLKNADIFLSFIGEEEGFIPPLRGLNALFLNLYVNWTAHKTLIISLKSNEMFVLRPLPVDIYYMIHQFHLWYGFKLGLPGFEFNEHKKFKRLFKTLKQEDISGLSIGEIIAIKETIARDAEAIDFVVNLSKEYDASKKLVNLMRKGKSVKV